MPPSSLRLLSAYRVMAYVVGVMLLALVLVAMPLKYLADEPGAVHVVGPLHGFLYFAYLVVTLALAVTARWSLARTVLVLLAGTIPFCSFVAERDVTRRERARILAGTPTTTDASR